MTIRYVLGTNEKPFVVFCFGSTTDLWQVSKHFDLMRSHPLRITAEGNRESVASQHSRAKFCVESESEHRFEASGFTMPGSVFLLFPTLWDVFQKADQIQDQDQDQDQNQDQDQDQNPDQDQDPDRIRHNPQYCVTQNFQRLIS